MAVIDQLKKHQGILLVAINVLVAFAVWQVWSAHNQVVELDEPLVYDAQIPAHVLDRLLVLRSPGVQSALIFLPSDAPQSSSQRYLRILAERYQSHGLGIAVVKGANTPRSNEPNVVVDDDNETIHHAFQTGVSHRHATVALISSVGRVKFHSLAPPQDDVMRQVVERNVLGRINYDGTDDVLADLFTEGARAPSISLTDINDGGSFRFDSDSARNTTVILVTAPCAPCQLSIVSRTISSIAGAAAGTGKVFVIAAPHFDPLLIKTTFAQLTSARIFTAASIPGYDGYQTRAKEADLRPIVVKIDDTGKLLSKEKFRVS